MFTFRISRRARIAGLALIAPLAVAVSLSGASAAVAGDTPPGFWYGTDSHPMPVGGSGPYVEPVIGGNYGGYVGMVGNWAHWQGCRGSGLLVWSATNAKQAAV